MSSAADEISERSCETPGCFRKFTTTVSHKCPQCLERHADNFWRTMGDSGRPITTQAKPPLQPLQFEIR